MEKPVLHYRVSEQYNPTGGNPIFVPHVCDRKTMGVDAVVEYALNSRYVRGKFENMRSALLGFLEAIKVMAANGMDITLSNWLRIHMELRGQVGETHELTTDNTLHVAATLLKEFKRSIDDFSWVNKTYDPYQVVISTIGSVGEDPNVVRQDNQSLLLTGENLYWQQELGDYAKLWVPVGGEYGREWDLSPQTASFSALRLTIQFWTDPSILEMADGSVLKFRCKLHGASAGGYAQYFERDLIYRKLDV